MNYKLLMGILGGVVMGGAIASFSTLNPIQATSVTMAQGLPHTTPRGGPANMPSMGQADQHFIEMMVPHHQEAVEMAELALRRAQHPEIKQLATSIIKDQTREINQMRTWYQSWYDAKVPTTLSGMGMEPGMMGRGTGMMGMHRDMMGMEMDLEALRSAPNFDQEFIRQMIPHHQMAVMMSQMVLNSATHPEMNALAQSIIQDQTAEINQMRQWYQAWYR
ncbi:MAG: DUF305 domain-containing protein [Leptolyngbyaceae bacterium]|nr:DUF305 domain-containing protein [Leptolyngbyaceae bacterium]